MKQVRRVVIAQDVNDDSIIVKDEPATNIDHYITGVDEAVSINLWSTTTSPTKLSPEYDPADRDIPFLPSTAGTVFRICDIPPNSSFLHRLDKILLNGHNITEQQKQQKHPLMHQVDALSYAIVLQGEVLLIVDKNETVLKAGDVVIDCGSNHAWSNNSDIVCRMAFILIDAQRK